MKVKIISIPNNINAAKWHACGGKLYPDGGPIDPKNDLYSNWGIHLGDYVSSSRDDRRRLKAGYMLPEDALNYENAVNSAFEYFAINEGDAGEAYRMAVAQYNDPAASEYDKAMAKNTIDLIQGAVNQQYINTGYNKLPQWYIELGLNELDDYSALGNRREAMRRIRKSGLPNVAKNDLKQMYTSERTGGLNELVNDQLYTEATRIPGVGDALSGISGLVNLASGNTGLGLLDLAAVAPFVAAPGIHKVAKGEVPLRQGKKVTKKVKSTVDGHRPNLSYLEETSGITNTDAQKHPIFANSENRIKREPRKSRYKLSDIDMSYMTDSQKEAVKPLVLGRKRGKKWVNINRENLFKGKSAAERAEIVAKELENMQSNTTNIPNTTQDIGNSKKGLKKVGQWVKDNPRKTIAAIGLTGTIPFWDDIGDIVELSNQRRENPGIVINPGDTVYQDTNTNTASDIDTTTDKYAANRALVENMAALDHDEIEWGRRQLDSVLNTKHSPMDSLIWENWIRQAIEDSAVRQNNYRR